MDKLDQSIRYTISAVLGWLELGNPREALAELERIPPEYANDPALLELRWTLNASEKFWDAALESARRLIEAAPEKAEGWLHQAYALRRVDTGGLEAAWAALYPALLKFPSEATVPYNLACYACQLSRMEEARSLLKQAMDIGERQQIKAMALIDTDFEPLWKEIDGW